MKSLIFFLLLITSFVTQAQKLTVLYDTGKATLYNKNSDSDIRLERPDPIKVLESQFPIRSKLWSVEYFKSKKVNFPNMRSPIFLIGCDDTSLAWIQHRKEFIAENRILGFVINCKSYEDYNELKAAIYPIVVQPANLDKLATHLNHSKYPAYIHKEAIEQ
ncbi:PFL_4695 family integrating conjugative element protein [Aliikangiella maris]|uniref:PFL_4695 family integrating conjugative element protein n=2 Tax=Aliikangiella maris TaxID=3162458 RepID=A0ABV2BYD0_9GAMM